MNNNIINEINNYMKENGLEKYLEKWELIKNKNFKNLEEFKIYLEKSIKNYHKHSFIISNNSEFDSKIFDNQKPPKFIWDKKNKIGRVIFYKFIMTNNNLKNQESEKLTKMLSHYYLNYWLSQEIKGLIIDLRYHKGGNFYPFTVAMKPILGNTTLFAWSKNKVDKKEKQWININSNFDIIDNQDYESKNLKFSKPIAVIISKNTSSAGEFAASIFYGRSNTRFFGQRSRGLLCVNETVKFNPDITLAIPTKFTTTCDGTFHSKEYLDVDVETNKPIYYAKEWIKKN